MSRLRPEQTQGVVEGAQVGREVEVREAGSLGEVAFVEWEPRARGRGVQTDRVEAGGTICLGPSAHALRGAAQRQRVSHLVRDERERARSVARGDALLDLAYLVAEPGRRERLLVLRRR